MWGKKKEVAKEEHIETAAEYWAKRDAERDEHLALEKQKDIASGWDGYAPITESLTTDELAALYSYELCAYRGDNVEDWYADGIQRISKLPRRK